MPDHIFISYRRDDAAYVTGHINDLLRKEFGSESVFTDVDNIALGVDFRAVLDESVSQCQVFLAVIGALCDIAALRASGELAFLILAFAVVLLLIHGLLVFGGTAILKGDAEAASVASQAAVGGGATALVLARSLRRPDLEVPSILVGALGNAVGTYLGIAVVLLL